MNSDHYIFPGIKHGYVPLYFAVFFTTLFACGACHTSKDGKQNNESTFVDFEIDHRFFKSENRSIYFLKGGAVDQKLVTYIEDNGVIESATYFNFNGTLVYKENHRDTLNRIFKGNMDFLMGAFFNEDQNLCFSIYLPKSEFLEVSGNVVDPNGEQMIKSRPQPYRLDFVSNSCSELCNYADVNLEIKCVGNNKSRRVQGQYLVAMD